MNKDLLLQKIAKLESKIDMLEAEFSHIDNILIKCGFPEGIKTLKETVNEVLSEILVQQKNSTKENF